MTRREYGQPCSLACALDTVGERWSLLIVRELLLGPLRFSELARAVGGAPTDVLTKRLRELEESGVVRRRELDSPSAGVVYELTELGRELEHPLLQLGRWGLNFQQVEDVEGLSASSLANGIRVILQPPDDFSLTLGVRSEGQSFRLRIENGWIDGARGDAPDADLTLGGSPREVMLALVAGAEEGVEIEGDRDALERLRAMVVLPSGLLEAALAEAGAPA